MNDTLLISNIQNDLRLLNKEENATAIPALAALYKTIIHSPRNPSWNMRDRVIVSKQFEDEHAAVLAHIGYFSKKELHTPEKARIKKNRLNVPEFSEHELSVAAGCALALKKTQQKNRVYTFLSHTELNGNEWTAAEFANTHNLSNLTVIIIEKSEIVSTLLQKFNAFGWNTVEADGQNVEHIQKSIAQTKTSTRPSAIILHE